MSGRIGGGRERPRRLEDRSSTLEDRSSTGQSSAPPSRHLWVGNLSHSISEGDLLRPFLRYGELESVAFQPGRSYAFINFKIDEGAIAALKALQGFSLAGSPLRIEFAKEKSSVSSHNEEYFENHSEQCPSSREPPLLRKDSRVRHASPDPFHPDRHKMNDKAAEPSEVLWIGFPASLKVDETILRKAFSPFGEIEKITTFPGRTYAFVRFINLISACRAKETLQGKLFGNPRVHICFAKNESGSSSGGRSSISGPLSPRYQSNGHHGSSESFWHDMDNASLSGNPNVRSPRTFTDLDSEGHDGYEFSRKGNLRRSGFSSLEHRRFGEEESELRSSHSVYEFRGSPKRDWDAHLPYPTQGFSQTGAIYEDQWDIQEEVDILHGPKRLKSDAYPPDNELPEFQLADLRRENQVFSHVLSDSVRSDSYGIEYEQMVRSDHPRVSYENIQIGSGSLPTVNVESKRITPEIKQSSMKEWKWEGTIAKGGSPVCRARCFPVGKVLDFLLPKFLDCTARTGLEMLAKHYYQASATWVIFFVPGTDADIGFYNEFMHYLEEKQRAAVAKLDERNTLFLVPPSDFSEKVLKVPGKLSISGVVLRLEQPGSKFGTVYHPDELKDPKSVPFPGDSSYLKPSTPSGTQFLETSKLGPGNRYLAIDAAPVPSVPFSIPLNPGTSKYDTHSEDRDEYLPQQQNLLQSNLHYLATSSGTRSAQSQLPSSAVDSIPRMVQMSANSGRPLSGNNNMPVRERETRVQSSTPLPSLQPEQLSQLASLLGQQRQSGSVQNISGGKSDGYGSQHVMTTSSELPVSHFGEVQPFHHQQHPQHLLNLSAASKEVQAGAQGSQQVSTAGLQEAEADPQKRLQATLQLAAALLQQIQQGNKGS
ncbi:hypothetical protein BT93_K1506 [Corymbia citriodora subsp. variegata]|nr:hypothetical protein BT93_K1506 [Corymbia citriodora subsp. variegata]